MVLPIIGSVPINIKTVNKIPISFVSGSRTPWGLVKTASLSTINFERVVREGAEDLAMHVEKPWEANEQTNLLCGTSRQLNFGIRKQFIRLHSQ